MNTPPVLRTRREFLRGSLLGAGTALTVPRFFQQTAAALETTAGSQLSPVTGKDGRILIVLQLAGGNDGLNTLVPFSDDAYHRARPGLGIGEKDALRLTDHAGLNPALPFLRSLHDAGSLAVLQGVGYPNPNRSHFRSTEIWQCATDADKIAPTGWLGRYFDHQCAGSPDPMTGVALTKEQPQSFFAAKNPGISLSSPQAYRWLNENDAEAAELFADLNQPDADSMTGGSVNMVGGGSQQSAESPLDFLERTALDARVSSDKITGLAARRGGAAGGYPGTGLGQQLSLVARMIAGGLPTRVYYVSHGGFDTHNRQGDTHRRLLSELDAGLKAFFTDLKTQGNADRICLMTFSEFGRRVAENASAGTDHGTAAPLFVMGAGVKAGLHGTAPSLTDLDRGDLKFTTDFRSVYATMLERWLQVPSAPILGREFPVLPFLA